jgi:hypothetical protein
VETLEGGKQITIGSKGTQTKAASYDEHIWRIPQLVDANVASGTASRRRRARPGGPGSAQIRDFLR